jgi:hypothetical protein
VLLHKAEKAAGDHANDFVSLYRQIDGLWSKRTLYVSEKVSSFGFF